MKNLYYGFLHCLVALTSILFVTGVTGINLPLTFLTIGIGTIIFHLLTKNRFAVLLGVSGSYIAGMTLVTAQYGPAYTAGGVVISGLIYIALGLLVKWKPSVLDLFPKYILNIAVLLIALSLMPIGASLTKSAPWTAIATILVTGLIYNSSRRQFAMPAGLITGTVITAFTTGLAPANLATNIVFTMPKFNLASLTLIGIVAIAVCFETLGNTMNCANAQDISLREEDMGNVLLGDGVASTISGALGALPLTSYSENVGFIYMSGWKNPWAQIFSSFVFMAMAGWAAIPRIFSYVPLVSYGAILIFLFSMVSVNAINGIMISGEKSIVAILMLVTYFVTPIAIPSFSQIAAAIIVGAVANGIFCREEK